MQHYICKALDYFLAKTCLSAIHSYYTAIFLDHNESSVCETKGKTHQTAANASTFLHCDANLQVHHWSHFYRTRLNLEFRQLQRLKRLWSCKFHRLMYLNPHLCLRIPLKGIFDGQGLHKCLEGVHVYFGELSKSV